MSNPRQLRAGGGFVSVGLSDQARNGAQRHTTTTRTTSSAFSVSLWQEREFISGFSRLIRIRADYGHERPRAASEPYYVDDETGYGFSGAYNFTNRFSLGLDVTWSDPAYSATIVPDGAGVPESVRANLDLNVIHFKGIFNLLDREITPYVEVGAGWTYVDSNIVEGYGGTSCWWDFWWGYLCNSYFDTYIETRTSHSYAVGIRWEIDSDWIFRAGWGVTEIDTSSEDIEVDTIQLTFGWRY